MIRLQFDVSEKLAKELNELQVVADLTSKKELFNNAFTLLQWAFKQIRSGKAIAAVDLKSGSYTELQMPVFDSVRRQNQETESV